MIDYVVTRTQKYFGTQSRLFHSWRFFSPVRIRFVDQLKRCLAYQPHILRASRVQLQRYFRLPIMVKGGHLNLSCTVPKGKEVHRGRERAQEENYVDQGERRSNPRESEIHTN